MLWPLIWWTSLSLSCTFSFLPTFPRASWSLISLEKPAYNQNFYIFLNSSSNCKWSSEDDSGTLQKCLGWHHSGSSMGLSGQESKLIIVPFLILQQNHSEFVFFYFLFVFALIFDWLIATRESDFIADLWHSYAFSILNSLGSPRVLLQTLIISWLFFGHRAPRTETSAFAMHIIITVGIIKYVHSGKEPSLLRFKKKSTFNSRVLDVKNII